MFEGPEAVQSRAQLKNQVGFFYMKKGDEHMKAMNQEREHRCACGQLLARITETGVQLKCKRCKRYILIPWEK